MPLGFERRARGGGVRSKELLAIRSFASSINEEPNPSSTPNEKAISTYKFLLSAEVVSFLAYRELDP
jgi:hypothetical protein